jgi:hypothetical protein
MSSLLTASTAGVTTRNKQVMIICEPGTPGSTAATNAAPIGAIFISADSLFKRYQKTSMGFGTSKWVPYTMPTLIPVTAIVLMTTNDSASKYNTGTLWSVSAIDAADPTISYTVIFCSSFLQKLLTMSGSKIDALPALIGSY